MWLQCHLCWSIIIRKVFWMMKCCLDLWKKIIALDFRIKPSWITAEITLRCSKHFLALNFFTTTLVGELHKVYFKLLNFPVLFLSFYCVREYKLDQMARLLYSFLSKENISMLILLQRNNILLWLGDDLVEHISRIHPDLLCWVLTSYLQNSCAVFLVLSSWFGRTSVK